MGWGSIVGAVTGGAWGAAQGNQADAAGRAAKKQQQSLDRATEIANEQFQQTRQDNMPALDARNASLDKMRLLLGIGGDKTAAGYGSLSGSIQPGDVQNEAGYQFGLNQGLTAQNNLLGARGMRNSGAAIKAATRYGNDYATTHYDNAFNRIVSDRNQQLNPLSVLAGAGQVGANTVAQAGQNYANTAGNNAIQSGNVGAAQSMGQANAWTNALNQGVSLGKNFLMGG